jgi:hypothetical protein
MRLAIRDGRVPKSPAPPLSRRDQDPGKRPRHQGSGLAFWSLSGRSGADHTPSAKEASRSSGPSGRGSTIGEVLDSDQVAGVSVVQLVRPGVTLLRGAGRHRRHAEPGRCPVYVLPAVHSDAPAQPGMLDDEGPLVI